MTPDLQSALTAALTALATLAVAVITYYTQRLGAKKIELATVDIEADARARLKEAMASGARAVIAKEQLPAGVTIPLPVKERASQQVIDYVLKSVPGAITLLNPAAGVLASLAIGALSTAMEARKS